MKTESDRRPQVTIFLFAIFTSCAQRAAPNVRVSMWMTNPALQNSARPAGRIEWIDVAKGLGIILVVIGHVRLPLLVDWVYRFHMPMFFMLSGMVYHSATAKSFLAKRVRSLLIPYASFLVLVTLADNVIELLHRARVHDILVHDYHRILHDFFGGRRLIAEFGVMWFITCLFVSILAYNLLRRRFADPLAPILIVMMTVLFFLSFLVAPVSLPWNLALSPIAIIFLWLGEVWMAGFGGQDVSDIMRLPVTWVALVFAPLSYFTTDTLDMKLGILGTPILSVIAALAWSHLILLACRTIARSMWLRRLLIPLGQASIVILFTHRLITDRIMPDLYPPLLVAVALAVPFLLYRLLKNFGPMVRLLFLGEPLPARAQPATRVAANAL